MTPTLKEIRTNSLHYTENDICIKLNISLDEYKKLENEPQIPLNLLMTLAEATGKTLDELLQIKKEKIEFQISNSWNCIDNFITKIITTINSLMNF